MSGLTGSFDVWKGWKLQGASGLFEQGGIAGDGALGKPRWQMSDRLDRYLRTYACRITGGDHEPRQVVSHRVPARPGRA